MPPFIAQNQARILPQRNIDVSGFASAIKSYRDKQATEEQNQMSGQILQQGFQDPKGAAVEAFKTGDRGLAGLMLKQHQAKLAAQQPQRVKQTALLQNLLAAGLKPGTPEFKNAILGGTKRQGTVVNNVLPGAEKGTNKLNEKLAERSAAFIDHADAVSDMSRKFDQINQLAQGPNVRTGTFGEFELGIKKFLGTTLGVDVKGLAPAEQISKVGDLLVGDIRKLQGDTRMSDSDRRAYRAIPPNLGDSKEGILLATEIMRKTAVKTNERRNKFYDLVEQNGGLVDFRVHRAFEQYKRDNPVLTPDDIKEARKLASGAKQTLPGVGIDLRSISDKDLDNLIKQRGAE